MRQRISVVDSHTGGEPTRVVVDGGPDLGTGTLAEKRDIFARDFDHFRSAIVNEPRGSDVVVGALLVPPADPAAIAGVIFFNNVGYLGMCGHGTIGVVATLAHLGRIGPGLHRLETSVGTVSAQLHGDNSVSVENVPAYRYKHHVAVDTNPGSLRGDVAWGGNWFFLVEQQYADLSLEKISWLTNWTGRIRVALHEQGITGANGAEIDHIELFGPAQTPGAHSRNFVLCPGGAYDRSPCGTGTSAKLACLLEDGKIAEGEIWRQESIIGSTFDGTIVRRGGELIPTITGRAHVNAEATLLLDYDDPFCWGIRPQAIRL